jgi:hypothetical protein
MADKDFTATRADSNPEPEEDDEPESAPRVRPGDRGPLREEAEYGYDPYAGSGYDDF